MAIDLETRVVSTHSCVRFPEADPSGQLVSVVDKIRKMVSLGIRVPVVELDTKDFNVITNLPIRSRP